MVRGPVSFLTEIIRQKAENSMISGYVLSVIRDDIHSVETGEDTWDEARLRHHLARHGFIPVQGYRKITEAQEPQRLPANAEMIVLAKMVVPRGAPERPA